MIEFPESTVVNRFVPKEKFYTKSAIPNKLRQQFTDEIERITWTHKISPTTLNITAKKYSELQVFEITLKSEDISISTLKHIDTFIPYPLLFIIRRGSLAKGIMSYKEPNLKKQHNMKVDTYYETSWLDKLDLKLKGVTVSEVYANFLYQIKPSLKLPSAGEPKVAVQYDKHRQKISRQIKAINKKIRNEPSIAKKQTLAHQRHALEKELISQN